MKRCIRSGLGEGVWSFHVLPGFTTTLQKSSHDQMSGSSPNTVLLRFLRRLRYIGMIDNPVEM